MGSDTHWPHPLHPTNTLCGAEVPSSAIVSVDSAHRPNCFGCRLVWAFQDSDIWDAIIDSYIDSYIDVPVDRPCTVCAHLGLACINCTVIYCTEHHKTHNCLPNVKRILQDWMSSDG